MKPHFQAKFDKTTFWGKFAKTLSCTRFHAKLAKFDKTTFARKVWLNHKALKPHFLAKFDKAAFWGKICLNHVLHTFPCKTWSSVIFGQNLIHPHFYTKFDKTIMLWPCTHFQAEFVKTIRLLNTFSSKVDKNQLCTQIIC